MTDMKAKTYRAGEGKFVESEVEQKALLARRRLVWSFAGALVVSIIITLLIRSLVPEAIPGSHRRSSYSTRADGFRGIYEVLGNLGFQVRRHHRSYGQLPAPEDSVLLVLDPLPPEILVRFEGTRFDDAQIRLFRDWVSRGGRVIFTPSGRSLLSFFGVAFDLEERDSDRSSELFDGAVSDLAESLWEGPLLERVWKPAAGVLTGSGELSKFRGALNHPPRGKELLALAYLKVPGGPQSALFGGEERSGPVEVAVFSGETPPGMDPIVLLNEDPVALSTDEDEGTLFFFSTAYPFTNLSVAECDSAPLLVSLVDLATEGGKRDVIFDEYSHGLWARRGVLGWISKTRLSYPVMAVLFFFFIVLWRGSVRLGAPIPLETVTRRAKEEFVASLADLALRARRYRAAARWILETYRMILKGAGRPDGGTVDPRDWNELSRALTRNARFGEEDLRSWIIEAEKLYRNRQMERRPTKLQR